MEHAQRRPDLQCVLYCRHFFWENLHLVSRESAISHGCRLWVNGPLCNLLLYCFVVDLELSAYACPFVSFFVMARYFHLHSIIQPSLGWLHYVVIVVSSHDYCLIGGAPNMNFARTLAFSGIVAAYNLQCSSRWLRDGLCYSVVKMGICTQLH